MNNLSSNVTFGELLNQVGRTDHITTLPRATQIRKSNAEILFVEQVFDATITVYKNGFVIYGRDEHETVTAVDRCASPVYTFSASCQEAKEGIGVAGCQSKIIRKNNGAILLSTIPEETFLEYPWYTPIVIICEARLDHNQESREEDHAEFHIDDENFAKDHNLYAPSVEDNLGLNGSDFDEKMIQHMAYEAAKPKMTEKQLEAATLYHSGPMTDKQVGQAMKEPCNQQMANRHRRAAYDKVKKEYQKIKDSLNN